MIKKAMVDIDKKIDNKKCKIILQVHDELMFECQGKESSPYVLEMAKLIREKMEGSIKLLVPVKVEVKAGQNWGEMTPLKV